MLMQRQGYFTFTTQFSIDIVMDRWDELDPREFASLSAELFYEMVSRVGTSHVVCSLCCMVDQAKVQVPSSHWFGGVVIG